jgi:hypothetical protein
MASHDSTCRIPAQAIGWYYSMCESTRVLLLSRQEPGLVLPWLLVFVAIEPYNVNAGLQPHPHRLYCPGKPFLPGRFYALSKIR